MSTPTPNTTSTVPPHAVTLRALLNKRQEKEIDFMGGKVKIFKLTIAQVEQIQTESEALGKLGKAWADYYKVLETNPEAVKPAMTAKDANKKLMMTVLTLGLEGAADLTPEDFQGAPMDDLNEIAEDIMAFSGMSEKAGK